MENQTNYCYNVPQYDSTTNKYITSSSNNNNNNNVNNYPQVTVPPSPSTQMSGSGDGDFVMTSSDFYTSDQDDLASVFLDLQKLAGIEDQHGSASGGDEVAKRARGRPRICGGVSANVNEPKKDAVSANKLDELKSLDPKRAKRILANRQSAARSKERKARYLVELERRIQALQLETIELTAQLRIYQRDTSGLTTENAELKIRLQVMEQQAQLRDALNEALKHEVDRLKIATGETTKTPTESYTYGGQRNVSYCQVATPSTLNYSPQPSPSTMQTVSHNSTTSSPSPQTNMFPLSKQFVPVLPPLHKSRSTVSNGRFHHLLPGQTDPLGRLQGFENIDNKGQKMDGSSITQMITP